MRDDLISRKKAYEVLMEYYHHKTEMQHKALREALDRVPSATQTNDSNTLNALDCVNRQAAIDEVCKMMYECFGADEEELDAIEVTLHELPSAEQKSCEYWDAESNYCALSRPSAQPEITEDDVKEYCRKRCLIVVTSDFYDEMMSRWSSAQPEIIRCKDCINNEDGFCYVHEFVPSDFGYCYFAERRTNG